MTDRSLPVGDRDAWVPRRPGPKMARDALGRMPAPEFIDRVKGLAETGGGRLHVSPDSSFPGLLVVRGDTLVVAHVGSGPPSYREQEWLAAFRRVQRVETYVWVTRDGLEAPAAVLTGPPALDECGQPTGNYDERGRRGD